MERRSNRVPLRRETKKKHIPRKWSTGTYSGRPLKLTWTWTWTWMRIFSSMYVFLPKNVDVNADEITHVFPGYEKSLRA